ncbi:MAG: ExbD/TolR family protein [Anaplasma sp.]
MMRGDRAYTRLTRYKGACGLHHDINVAPFIDVMLVLLVIFMISHTEKAVPSLPVSLPQANKAVNLAVEQPVILTITAKGNIYVGSRLSGEASLSADLMAATKGRETQVFLRGDRELSYGSVVRVVNLLLSLGLRKVALVTGDGVVANVDSGRT